MTTGRRASEGAHAHVSVSESGRGRERDQARSSTKCAPESTRLDFFLHVNLGARDGQSMATDECVVVLTERIEQEPARGRSSGVGPPVHVRMSTVPRARASCVVGSASPYKLRED